MIPLHKLVGLMLGIAVLTGYLQAQPGPIQSEIDSAIAEAKDKLYASPDESMAMGWEILENSNAIGYQHGELEGYRLIGNSYFLMGRLDSAAYYMMNLLDLAYDAENLGMQADVMIDIGQTYDKIGIHSLAYDYFIQAHQIRQQTGEPERLAVTLINLAYHFYLRDELDTALVYYEQTKAILDTIPLNYTTPFLYNELGGVCIKQGKYAEARSFINKAIEMNLQLDNNWDLTYNYALLAELELKEDNVEEAEKKAMKALDIAKESNISIEDDLIYKILSEVNRKKGLYREALNYFTMSQSYSDSLNTVFTEQKILALDIYKRQKENEISTLKLTNENLAQKARISSQRSRLWSVAIGLVLTLATLIVLLIQNRKLTRAKVQIDRQNLDLRNLNATKNKLFSIITHDIRNPLSNINGMLELVKDGRITTEEFGEFSTSLLEQTGRLTNLTETLIKWSRSQQGGLKASPKLVNLNALIEKSIAHVEYMAESKQISVSFDSKVKNEVMIDPDMISLAISNILTNAIKFTPDKGTISVLVRKENKSVVVDVRDTGIGIDVDLFEKLVNGEVVSSPGTNEEKGTGIGLILTLDLVSLNHGKLWAERNPDGGSTFHISLPFKG